MSDVIIKLPPRCGLCNRLRTIFHFLNKLEKDQHLLVVWTSEKHDNIGELYDYFERIPNLHFCTEHTGAITYKGCGNDLPGCTFTNLRPLPYIVDEINRRKSYLGRDYIAIHVRRTDIDGVFKNYKIAYDKSYVSYINFIDRHPTKALYIATDNVDTYTFLHDKYKDTRAVNNAAFIHGNRRNTTTVDSVVDLYMCAHASAFLGTDLSSFTDFILANRDSHGVPAASFVSRARALRLK